jgi:hypothetical protein
LSNALYEALPLNGWRFSANELDLEAAICNARLGDEYLLTWLRVENGACLAVGEELLQVKM